jgi:hypothetical protein
MKMKLTLERDLFVSRLRRVEAKELGELAAVLGIFVNTELQVLGERLVEVDLVLGNLSEEAHTLLDDILADNLEDLVLLKRLTRYVQGEILGVDNTLDEVAYFGDDVLAIVHDEDTANVKLDVVALLLAFEEVEWCTTNRLIRMRQPK